MKANPGGLQSLEGKLEIGLANEQSILFPKPTTKRFIKFLVTDALSLDGKSLASIGKLDVMTTLPRPVSTIEVSVASSSPKDLKKVIKRFAQKAFSSNLSEEELAPYYGVSLNSLKDQGDFVMAAKVGLKAIVCSHRFLMAPGEHANRSYGIAADLARILWLSVPGCRTLEPFENGKAFCTDDSRSNRTDAEGREEPAHDPFVLCPMAQSQIVQQGDAVSQAISVVR